MSRIENDFSSSDEEDAIDTFKEACDEEFLPQSLYSSKDSSINGSSDGNSKKETERSLRETERFDDFENFGVSQQFKDYVAKKLDAMLDKNIVDQVGEYSEDKVPKKRKKKQLKGIKLLSSSDEIITKIEEPKDKKQERSMKTWKYTRESEYENIKKCQEAAVDPEWIISKKETKAWSEKRKGVVFKYKKGCNGTLVEQD